MNGIAFPGTSATRVHLLVTRVNRYLIVSLIGPIESTLVAAKSFRVSINDGAETNLTGDGELSLTWPASSVPSGNSTYRFIL